MIIILCVIATAIIVTGVTMIRRSDYGDDALAVCGGFVTGAGVVSAVAVVIAFLVLLNSLVKISTIDERIAMCEEQNAEIEAQIETVVRQYQEYESGIMTEVGDKESYITLVSLYPELKADALVSKQIEVYLNNNETIVGLKNQKLNEKVYRWWLYFGGLNQ